MLEVGETETIWLNPEAEGNAMCGGLVWEASMCADNSSSAQVWDLMARAFKAPLSQSGQDELLAELDADAKIVYQCGLTPHLLPDLVENNPMIAIDCLLRLCTSSNHITDYLSALVNMDMSLHSMEVVNRELVGNWCNVVLQLYCCTIPL